MHLVPLLSLLLAAGPVPPAPSGHSPAPVLRSARLLPRFEQTAQPPAAATTPRPEPAAGIHPGWFVAGAGGVSLLAGGVVYGLAASRYAEISSGQATFADRTSLWRTMAEIGTQQTVALVLVGAGVALAGGGSAWALLPPPQVAISSRAVSVSFSWVLP